jgi:hypothetical protein
MAQAEIDLPSNSLPPPEIYQLHFLLLEISPAISRRLLVRSDCTIHDLHFFLQIAFGWSDTHLNRFSHHAKTYGVYHPGGMSFNADPKEVCLQDLKLRLNECFHYYYDFNDKWCVQIRLEQKLPFNPEKNYPHCIAGKRIVPPEDCGGPATFVELEASLNLALWEKKQRLIEIMTQILPDIMDGKGRSTVEPYRNELGKLLEHLKEAEFDRQKVNTRLKQYVDKDPAWLEAFRL